MLLRNFPISDSGIENIPWEKREKVFLYLGILSVKRGIEQIAALGRFLDEHKEFGYKIRVFCEFVPGEEKKLESLLAQISPETLELNRYFIDHKEALREIENSKFGIAFFTRYFFAQVENTTANKIFEYMLHGAIPLVTAVPGMDEYISHLETGVLLPAEREAEEIMKMLPLLERDGQAISDAGRKSAQDNFLWDIEKERLIKYFETLNIS